MRERISAAVLWARHHGDMPVGVVDVGSNTVRLHVTRVGRTVLSRREMLRLGADVERSGCVSEQKLERAAEVVAAYAAAARAVGVSRLEVLITSPGRQAANGAELLARLEAAADAPARILSAQEEGRLAFVGALEIAAPNPRRSVAVVDVGGGSAQVVVGTRRDGPLWSRSIDLGSQRLTSRMLSGDPPGASAIGAARAEVERYLDGFDAPAIHSAYAVGGSARSLKRIAGSRLDRSELEDLLALLAVTPSAKIGARHDIGDERARTLPAGAVILSAIQRHLGVPLRVVRGGLREGALLALDQAERAAA